MLFAGDMAECKKYASAALAFVDAGDRFGEPHARRVAALAEVVSDQSGQNQAEAQLQRSAQLARRRGQCPQAAITHFRYAECLHKKGDLDAAQEKLDQAEKLFGEMGMDWWMKQAQGLRGRIDRGEPFKWFAPYVDGPPQITEQQ